MPVLKKYNAITQQWEPINQAPAVGVYTDNAVLTTEEDPVRSVEDVLVQNRQEIDLLRKNVTWLALHGGGGGYGGGGGSFGNEASVQIFDPADNTTDVTEFIWNKSYETSNLVYKVSSNTSTSTYTVHIRVNGVLKKTEYNVKRNVNQTISTKVLGIGSKEDTISITAIDRDENEFTKNCKVIIASVVLQEPAASTFTQSVLLNGNPQITLRYKVSIAGNYKLYYSDSRITYDQTNGWSDANGPLEDSNTSRSQYIDILNSGTSYNNININLTNIYNSTDPSEIKELLSKNTSPGSYVRYFLLVKADNNNIYSSLATAQINVVLTNGMLVTPSMGVDTNNRYTVTADAILNLRFITWKGGNSSGTYSYRIFVGDTELKDLAKSGQIFGSVVNIPINISTYQDVFPTTGNYDIKILASQTPYESTGVCYITIAEKSTDVVRSYLKNIKNFSVVDYTFWDATWNKNADVPSNRLQYENDTFDYRNNSIKDLHKTYMDFYNVGEDSGLKAGGGIFYKLTHTAGGQITCDKSVKSKIFPMDNNDTDALIPGNEYNFSLQVAYSIDVEPSDDVIVFRMGDYNINTGLGQGVVITAHNYYVKIDNTVMTGSLQDNTFTQFDLVCFRDDLQMRWIYIYQNGVLLQAAQHSIPSTGYSLFNIDRMFVACDNINIPMNELGVIDEAKINVEKPINTDLYSVRLYNTRLSDGEIVCSYINNYVNYKRTATGLDVDLVNNMLQNNLINADKYVNDPEDPQPISRLFNFRSESSNGGDYNWNLSVTNNKVNLGNLADLPDKSGIPIVVLSVKDWSWDQFTKTGADFVNIPKTGTFTYIYPGNSDGISSNNNVTVELQGTSTLGYGIKNLDVTFNNEMFSPKDTWFPEKVFTLKADVVDSAHVNNAAIGTFVNDCINKDTNGVIINKGAFPAAALIDKYKNTEKTLPQNLTFKATIEGFPVVLVIDFENGGMHDPRVIGIYSFNLGRESYYNQGLEVLTKLRNTNGDVLEPGSVSFPSMFGTPTLQDIDSTYDAYCFEGTKSTNTTVNKGRTPALNDAVYDYAIVMDGIKEMWYPIVENIGGYVGYDASHYIFDSNGDLIPWDANHVRKVRVDENGYFWSNDPSFAKGLFECKYAKNETKAWDQFCNESGAFGADESYLYLTGCLSTWLPYRKGAVLRDIGAVIPKWKMTGGTGDIAETVMTSDTITLTRPQQVHGLPISVQNSAFYYVVCMLFGLIDNFGKNLQFKYWGDPDNKSNLARKWSPTFYDMDTALGISNTGSEDVPPTVFDESIINLPDSGNARFMYGSAPNGLTGFPKTGANATTTVYSNKMWGCFENSNIYSWYALDYGSESGFRVYSEMWNSIRSIMVNSVDDLMDKYFTTNLSKCGEFLYNYDYYTKYLNTSEYNMLHGNRRSFIHNWLTERIAFLDSVFGYRNSIDEQYKGIDSANFLTSNSLMPYNISWNNSINVVHNSGSITMPIKSNKSLIYCTQIGGGTGEGATKTYRYLTKNQEDTVKVADSLDTQGIQTKISNSDCIIDLPNLQSIKLTGITALQGATVKDKNGAEVYDKNMFASIKNQQASLSGLKRFDISGINTINGTIDLFNLFKTWDTSGLGMEPQEFALQELNYSNTSTNTLTASLTGINSTDTSIPEIYKAPFVNLTSIDISNSQVSSVDIPRGVTLQKLNVENSSVAQLVLTEQPLLTSLNLNKCPQLNQIQLVGCNRLEKISLNSSNVNVKDITISECAILESITIDAGNKWNNIPTITIQNCPKLKEIKIKNCNKDNYVPQLNDTKSQIVITGTPNLEVLNINNSMYTSIIWDGAENLTKLNVLDISKSSISRIDTIIHREEFDRNFVDLRGFDSDQFVEINTETGESTGVTQLNFKNCSNIQYVYTNNVGIVKDGNDYKINVPKPFVFSNDECFAKCSNLKRIYGYIHVAASKVFEDCSMFTIHGEYDGDTLLSNPNIQKMLIKTYNTEGIHETTMREFSGNHGDIVDLESRSEWITTQAKRKGGHRLYHATDFTSTDEDGKYIYNLLRQEKDSNGNFNGKYRYCWVCKRPEIVDGEYVFDNKYTNLMISGSNVSNAFTKTSCDAWDVYYTLFNCDSDEINISGLFSDCERVDFSWVGNSNTTISGTWTEDKDLSEKYLVDDVESNCQDNSPSRFTFMNCSGATAANGVFATTGLCKIKSPYVVNESNISWIPGYKIGDVVPGLYTPFKNKCINIGRIVSGSCIMDKNVLRTFDDTKFAVVNLTNLKCKNFVYDVNAIEYVDGEIYDRVNNTMVNITNGYTSALSTYIQNEDFSIITGDVTDLLVDCPNIVKFKGVLADIDFLNYDTICGENASIKIPAVEIMLSSFSSTYAKGDLVLSRAFVNTDSMKKLKNINSCFICLSPMGNENGTMLEFKLNNDVFTNCVSLETIKRDEDDGVGMDSFYGLGIHKYIDPDEGIPYNIFANCPNLMDVVAFFAEADARNVNANLELPGTMFENNPKIRNLQNLYFNLKTEKCPFRLSSGSFANCPNLQNVSYMFACDNGGTFNAFRSAGTEHPAGSDTVKHQYIPTKLFYHGSTKATSKVIGSNYEEMVSGVTYDSKTNTWSKDSITYSGIVNKIDDNTIKINPATTIKENGITKYLVTNNAGSAKVYDKQEDNDLYFVEFTYDKPNTNIINMDGCFQGGDWVEYVAEYGEPEINSEYSPFKYVLNAGQWKVNPNYSPHTHTYAWVYDGDWMAYDAMLAKRGETASDYPMYDDAYGCNIKSYRLDRSIAKQYGSQNGNNTSEVSNGGCWDGENAFFPNLELDMGGKSLELSGKFCCAPDLLRYCKANGTSLIGLFNGCGPMKHRYSASDQRYSLDNINLISHYGLKGRLVPYLFKPTPFINNLTNMFYSCKFIGAYVKESNGIEYAYPIPESFMNYITTPGAVDLKYTFFGWYFPARTNLNVFTRTATTSSTYKLHHTFEFPLFSNRINYKDDILAEDSNAYIKFPATEVRGLFVNDLAQGIEKLFNLSLQDDETSNGSLIRNQSVTFSNIFGPRLSGYGYVFAGYTNPNNDNNSWGSRFSETGIPNSVDEDTYKNYMEYPDVATKFYMQDQ